jgi:hypothetical protein
LDAHILAPPRVFFTEPSESRPFAGSHCPDIGVRRRLSLHARVRHVILLAIVRSNGGEMRYIPDWETLAETLARVMTTNGLSTSEGQRDICRALGDAKIRVQPTIDQRATEIGSQPVDVPLSPWRGVRQRLERQKIGPVPLVPKNLDPHDFDWENSRPKSAWLDNRGFSVGLAKIELLTADVIRVLCGGRIGRQVSDAVVGGSSAGLEVQASEPPSSPETEIASAGQVAPPRRKSSPKRDRAQRAIDEEYPGGVPKGTTDMELFKAVGRKLGTDTPSLETVRRAAGRRSK